jgi:hypothetical protein
MMDDSLIQIDVKLEERPCFTRPEIERPRPNTDNKTEPVEGMKIGFNDDTEVGNIKRVTPRLDECMSTVIKATELKAVDDGSLLNTDDSDDQNEFSAIVEPSSSASDRDENDKSCPNAVIKNDPVFGDRRLETLDCDGA